MKSTRVMLSGFISLLVLALMLPTGCGKQETEEQTETQKTAESEKAAPEVELPATVLETIEANVPDAEIDFVEMIKENGTTLYDIEFKEGKGEIEVAEDGTVIDIVTIITMEELPEAAAGAIKKNTEGFTIKRLEKSEIHSEIKEENEKAVIAKLDTYRYVYEAELEKGDQTGEITVDADGNIVEALKWDKN